MRADQRIAVIGCGLGGAALAIMLQRRGFNVSTFEQADAFTRIGAGIHLTPNVVRVLEEIGVAAGLLETGCRPRAFTSRDAHTGEIIAELTLGDACLLRYGTPYLTVHRGDFHAAMVAKIDPRRIQYGKRLTEVTRNNEAIQLDFADGSCATVDLVVGADGLSSVVRRYICGDASPTFAGQIAYRAILNPKELPAPPVEDLTKWWSDERFVIAYYLTGRRDQYYFVAGAPADSWPLGLQSQPADREQMIRAFADFRPEVRQLLEAARDVRVWPLNERPPEPAWSKGPLVLLGDACHPMRPHMTQGAAMAIEDAAVLVECLEACGPANWQQAYASYQARRAERTAKIQAMSTENSWLRSETDPSWVFGYGMRAEDGPALPGQA